MSIGQHHFLRIFTGAVFYIAGMIAFLFLTDRPAIGIGLVIAGFFAGALASRWFMRSVPVLCPRCKGQAYAMISPEGRLCFQCRRCGKIQETGFTESDLSD